MDSIRYIQVIKNLLKDGFAHVFVGTFFNKAVAMISSVVVARIVDKTDYAYLTYSETLYGYLTLFLGLGMSTALLKVCSGKETTSEDKAYLAFALKYGVVFEILITTLFCVSVCLLVLPFPQSKTYIVATVLYPTIYYGYDLLTSFVRSKQQNKAYAWYSLTYSFVTCVLTIAFVFLFTEAFGLFSSKVIEEGYVLALNKDNKVSELTPMQIKDVFDEEITNWKELGGEDLPIRVFRLEDITHYYSEEELGEAYENAGEKIMELIQKTPGIVAFIPQKFVVRPDAVHFIKDNTISVKEVFAGAEWFPTATPAPLFGFLPLITGTLWVSLFAILIALPFGLSVSIYMSEVADSKVRSWLKPVIELLSGIPSVVYGFFGLIVIVPLIQKVFDLPVGESGLAGSIVLAIMALPTIITVTEDAMRNCPRAMREASLALGASQWQTIYKVVIPYSISGITSGVVLGIGRAIGETMAVLMVTGNAAVIPTTILEPLRTIPATIAAELGEAPAGGPHYQALFLLGVVLFFITLIINFSVEYISSKGVKRSK